MTTVRTNTAQQMAQKQQEAIDSITGSIKPASEIALSEPSRFCFYGEPKAGKTTLAASSGLKTLMIEADPGGLEPIADKEKFPNVDAVRVTKWEQMDGLFWYAHSGRAPYEMYVFDTITMLHTLCLRWTMDNETRLDALTPQTPHHQRVARVLNNEILRWATLSDAHLVFLAQQRNIVVKREELGGEETLQRIVPNLPPSPLATLLAAVGTIGRLYTKEVPDPEDQNKLKVQRRLLLAPVDRFYAGTRIRGLPKLMADPSPEGEAIWLKAILDIRSQMGEVPAEEGGLEIITQDLLDEEYAARQAATEDGSGDGSGDVIDL